MIRKILSRIGDTTLDIAVGTKKEYVGGVVVLVAIVIAVAVMA